MNRKSIRVKCKTKRKGEDKYKKLWDNIHDPFSDSPKLPIVPNSGNTYETNTYFTGSRFEPMPLVEFIIQEYCSIRYVHGCFYYYTSRGVYAVIEENELGSFIQKQLGSMARARYIDETIKLLQYTANSTNEEFKAPKGLINLQNGMFEIETGKLLKHDPKYNSRYQLPYACQEDAECPLWKQFLLQVFADDKDKIRTLQMWCGYCLTHETFLQMFMIFMGSGGNGKSVVISVLTALVGQENICAISLHKMEKDFMLVTLKDKLVNLCGEINTGKQFDSDTIKLLTGEDSITVDVKYHAPITFKPTAKHIFSTNELPKFKDKTEALRRRLILLPFNLSFKGKNQNKNLTNELLTELPGILNWALEGWKQLQATQELYESPSALKSKDKLSEALNPALSFIRNDCRLSEEYKIKRSTLYMEYEIWHRNNVGKHPLSKPEFFERVRDDFPEIREIRLNGVDHFRGIKVLKPKCLVLK
jgi:putative DNA primase/helicase